MATNKWSNGTEIAKTTPSETYKSLFSLLVDFDAADEIAI